MSQISAFVILVLIGVGAHAVDDVDPNLARDSEIQSGLPDQEFCPNCTDAQLAKKLQQLISKSGSDLRYILKDPGAITKAVPTEENSKVPAALKLESSKPTANLRNAFTTDLAGGSLKLRLGKKPRVEWQKKW